MVAVKLYLAVTAARDVVDVSPEIGRGQHVVKVEWIGRVEDQRFGLDQKG